MPSDTPEPLEPDAVISSEERLFPYDKGQPPASEAVKRRRWRPRGGGRRRPAQSAERHNEGRRRT
jgi:hypothetical protein